MQLGKKTSTIGLAVVTLLTAILSLSPYGSASKCTEDCTGQGSTSTAYASTAQIVQDYKTSYDSSVYAASADSLPAMADPLPVPARVKIAKENVGTRNKEVIRRTLVAILLLCATESHRTSMGN